MSPAARQQSRSPSLSDGVGLALACLERGAKLHDFSTSYVLLGLKEVAVKEIWKSFFGPLFPEVLGMCCLGYGSS